MLLGLIVAIHSRERPIRACHLALMTKQTTENRLTENRPAGLDWVRPVSGPGRQPSRPGCLRRDFSRPGQLGPIFNFKLVFLSCSNFKLNSETSGGYIFFIRAPFFENSDSISRIFPRRTQWRIPFPLVL